MADRWDPYSYGSIHLNPIFVQASRPKRIKSTTVRVSGADIFFTIVALVPTFALVYGLISLLGLVPFLDDFISWWQTFLIAPVVAVIAGRLLAVRINPYARDSGESLGEYLKVFKDNAGDIIWWRSQGQQIAHVRMVSRATGRPKMVDGTVWLGTARSQYVPISPKYPGQRGVRYELAPSTFVEKWPKQAMQRRRERQRAADAYYRKYLGDDEAVSLERQLGWSD